MSNADKKIGIVIGTGAGGLRALTGAMRPAPILDQVGAAPCIQGPKGRAWCVDILPILAKHPERIAQNATLGVWVVEAPWAHPIWHSYVIGLSHLRPLPGAPAAVICRPGATHEFWIWAANPEANRDAFIRGAIGIGEIVLTPMNFAAQLKCAFDSEAVREIQSAIQDICNGTLNPDTDAFGQWVDRFGPSLLRAAPTKPEGEALQ